MADLAHLRCFNHAGREAVARCPECRRTFCRECITEHEDRVICATCLGLMIAPNAPRQRHLAWLLQPGQIALGITLLWLLFFAAGRALVALPTPFHEGTLWSEVLAEGEP